MKFIREAAVLMISYNGIHTFRHTDGQEAAGGPLDQVLGLGAGAELDCPVVVPQPLLCV